MAQRLSNAHNAGYGTARPSITSAEDEEDVGGGNTLLGKGDGSEDNDDLTEGEMDMGM